MRLSWPFGRARPDADASASAQAHASGDGASAASLPPPGEGGGGAWRSLPPLAETIGPPPVVAPTKPFAASLAADNPPPPILGPLSHGRGLEAPSGIVVGMAKPVAVSHGASIPAPVQRSPLLARSSANASDAVAEAPDAGSAEQAPAELPRLAVVSATPATPTRSLVTGGGAGISAPRGLVLPPRPAGSASVATPTGVQRAPVAAETSKPSGDVTSSRSAPEPTPLRPPATPPASDSESRRMTLGQSRRRGLGAPIAGGPIVQRVPATPDPPSFEAPAAPTGAAEPATREPVATPELRPNASKPPRPAQGASTTSVPATSGPANAGSGMVLASRTAPGIQRAPGVGAPLPSPEREPRRGQAASALPPAPLTSARPLRTGLQRAPLTLPSPARDATESGAALPVGQGTGATIATTAPTSATGAGPVKVHRDQAAGDLSRSLDARSFTHAGEIFLPSSHGPLTSGTGKSLLAHELTHVAQQRRLGSSLPGERSPSGQALEAEAVAAERSPLPRPLGVPAAKRGGEPGTSSESRSSAPQRAPAELHDEVPPHATGTTTIELPGAQRAPARSRPTPATDRGAGAQGRQSDRELDDLAQRIYSRIGSRLRRELLVDRERAGLAIDL